MMEPGPGASAVIKAAPSAYGAPPDRRCGGPYPSGRRPMFASGFCPGRPGAAASAW